MATFTKLKLFVLSALLIIGGSEAACNVFDSGALLDFANGFNDTGMVLSSWRPFTDCCAWAGVKCSATGRVEGLEVVGLPDSSMPLVRKNNASPATVGQSLGRLTALKYLYLIDVSFNAPAPTSISQLFATLTELILIRCNFTGPIPPSYGNLINLQQLALGSSFAGPIPSDLCKLTNLLTFDLSTNSLTGPFPSCVTQLKSLTTLRLDGNLLSGPLPADLGNLSPVLDMLSLGSNQFTGPIPVAVTKLASLRLLLLENNQLTGSIPSELARLKNLEVLTLNQNSFTAGPLPGALTSLPQLTYLDLSATNRVGEIPSEFGALAALNLFFVSNNALTGAFPASFGTLPAENRVQINVAFNQLSGPLPAELGNLYSFNGSHNAFTGAFPLSLTGATTVDLSYNQLSTFPSASPAIYSKTSALKTLVLAHNQIAGELPPYFTSLSKLKVADLSQNQISGGFPAPFLALPSLAYANVSTNAISGPVVSFTSSSLVSLDLHSNRLNGTVPDGFVSGLPSLKFLDLSQNSLTCTCFKGNVAQ